MSEISEIKARYDRRKVLVADDYYSPLRAVNLLVRQERERSLVRQLNKWLSGAKLTHCKIAEIGCGDGANLIQLISLGADPSLLIANDLLPERLEKAKNSLPASVTFLPGNGLDLAIAKGSQDIVLQSTVFSSILDSDLKQKLANAMLSWLRPGGAVLWYDFVYNNPRNPDVRGVKIRELKSLFPGCSYNIEKVTLAPPIARVLGRAASFGYPILNTIPQLRTHITCLIQKPNEAAA